MRSASLRSRWREDSLIWPCVHSSVMEQFLSKATVCVIKQTNDMLYMFDL